LNPRTPTGRDLEMQGIIDYSKVRDGFIKWVSGRVSKSHVKKMVSYLDKYLLGRTISSKEELLELKQKASSEKNFVVAVRNLLNYYETFELMDDEIINKYRKILKCARPNVDSFIPPDDLVREIYHKINREDYKLVYEILAFSGLRVTEVVKFLNEYQDNKLICNRNFARYPLFYQRTTKHAFYVYLPITTAEKLERMRVSFYALTKYFRRKGLPPKYLRKWNYNFMIMHNVPESVADFIQGRVPVTIGSMHYLAKVKQADYWYGKIANLFISMLY